MAKEVPAPAPLSLRALFAASWRMLRLHPVVSGGLGCAVVLSFASIVFGIGVVVTPWFVCEIFALQLAILSGRPTVRTRAWIGAGLVASCMGGLVAAATWVAALAIGPDVSTADSAMGPLPWPEALRRVGLIAGVTALTVGFIAPFAYAPLILIERGGRIGEAVLESAWLVGRGGLARHWALVFLAHLLPFAPAIVAAVAVARTFERAATPVGVLLGLPLLPFTIPFGQGLLSAAYAARRHELPDRRWTRAESSAPLALRTVLVAAVLAPLASVAMLAVGALRPSLPEQREGRGILVAEQGIEGRARVLVPGTTLEVLVDGREVAVRAGDGGGTGVLGAPWPRPVERVRVLRRRDTYDVELASGEARWVVRVDRAGVRVDDPIGRRLGQRLPWWALSSIALAFLLGALLLARGLGPLGAIRRAYGAPADARASLPTLRAERSAALRRAWIVAAILAPAGALALVGGSYAIFG
ncbi:MAG TPA: hypothetical protein VIL20_24830 [Sandaracinaceae bacterium]